MVEGIAKHGGKSVKLNDQTTVYDRDVGWCSWNIVLNKIANQDTIVFYSKDGKKLLNTPNDIDHLILKVGFLRREDLMRKHRNRIGILVFFVFSLFICASSIAYEKEIRSLSSALAQSIFNAGKKTAAVVDFVDLQGNVTELGRFLAEELSVAISESGKGLEVVDRTHLKTLLKEHQLDMTGLIDPKTAKKIGEISGVHVLVTGTLTPLGDTIRLAVKALDASTAKLVGGSRGDIPKTKAIEELLVRGIGTSDLVVSQTQPASKVYTPSVSSIPPKKVGDVTIGAKKITVAPGQTNVYLDFFNNSNSILMLGAGWNDEAPDLMDEKGGKYSYVGGIYRSNNPPVHIPKDIQKNGVSLSPKSNNDVVIKFRPSSSETKGSSFSFSLNFILVEAEGGKHSKHTVSFMGIKAQR